MAIRPDDQLLDGTYGTTNPIIPKNAITSERHRDIIESKVSRYSIQNPDETTPEGQMILENNQRQDEQDQHLEEYKQSQEIVDNAQNERMDTLDSTMVKSVNGEKPDAEGDVDLGELVKSVNNIEPDENGNVQIEVTPPKFQYIANLKDANGTVCGRLTASVSKVSGDPMGVINKIIDFTLIIQKINITAVAPVVFTLEPYTNVINDPVLPIATYYFNDILYVNENYSDREHAYPFTASLLSDGGTTVKITFRSDAQMPIDHNYPTVFKFTSFSVNND